MIDEATRYKVVAVLPDKTAKTLCRIMLYAWLRYFGSPRTVVSDQEGAIKSETYEAVCDRYSMHRVLAGSDAKGEHSTTGLAEKHIQLIKLGSLKCEHQCRQQGLMDIITDEDIVAEVTMH